MSLTNDERRALREIESELRRGDPKLAERMENALTIEQRRRRVVLARRVAWLGASVMFIGLMSARGLLSVGAVVTGYGLVILLISIGVAAYHGVHVSSIARGAGPFGSSGRD